MTPDGEIMLYNREKNTIASINKPGPSKMDLMQGAFTASLFAPASKPAQIGKQIAGGMGTAAAIEAGQMAAGGEFNPLDVAVEGVIPVAGPMLKGGFGRFKNWITGAK